MRLQRGDHKTTSEARQEAQLRGEGNWPNREAGDRVNKRPYTPPFTFPLGAKPIADIRIISALDTLVTQYLRFFHSTVGKLDPVEVRKGANPFKVQIDQYLGITDDDRVAMKASESSETKLGDLLEEVAISLNEVAFNGMKTGTLGVDIQFCDPENTNRYFLVSVKSKSNWSNASSAREQGTKFQEAKRTLKTSSPSSDRAIIPVCGCVYGKSSLKKLKVGYYQIAGVDFWRFISGDPQMESRLLFHLDDILCRRFAGHQQASL